MTDSFDGVYCFTEIQSEAKKIGTEVIHEVLDTVSYHAVDVHQWTAEITKKCLKELKNIANGAAGFKFIVNCAILQKRNTGFHQTTSCFWDAKRDGSVVVRWENATMACILTIYCVSLQM
ncbi:unnamed protein product [Albugo candida]|uniref:Dynein light chain n=1 Tax=Albugo candida TaxID=65357 RepID=A0A024GKX1_9STRA|nr:unnamed protein product [Albugo candida]|eukprot:CCI46971.1 unnamed protein product [Albugo candida]